MMSARINDYFSSIYGYYDLLNHLFSLGIDNEWRKKAAELTVLGRRSYRVLDAGAGTADLSIQVHRAGEESGRRVSITGIDLNERMLGVGRRKVRARRIGSISLRTGDALRTGFADSSFDVVTSGFVLRNLDDLDAFARESNRVLKTGGRVVLLDMASPDSKPGRAFFLLYSRIILLTGYLLRRPVYAWLVHSIMNFDKKGFARILRKNGFEGVRTISLRTGIAFVTIGTKRRSVSSRRP